MRRTMGKAKLEVLELGSGLSEGFPENDIKSCMWAGGLPYQVMKKMILVANKRLPKPPQRHLEGSIYPSGFLQTHSSLQRNHVSSETPWSSILTIPHMYSFRPRRSTGKVRLVILQNINPQPQNTTSSPRPPLQRATRARLSG